MESQRNSTSDYAFVHLTQNVTTIPCKMQNLFN